ncbi:putative assembly protein [Pigmentiphaga humi]|uniref:Putative assembly protein n=1 Tax=Pigmentiphaga humi TaxID=2478468 RepID=A0A3P4B1C5_9BURK|nr:AsmA family protein [Pigmentiphaga humi]VCU69852.1 putative assembly protein [Pigmentiphaga humi]
MRTTTKLLAAVAGLIVILVIAAFLTDWRFLRGPVERIASDKLGRQVTLDDFRMRLRPVTRIRLQGLKVANIDGAEHPEMARADTVELHVRVLPLLHRAVVLERLAVDGARAYLARAKDGSNNWTLAREDDGGPPLDLTVRTLSLNEVEVNYDDRMLDVSAKLHAASDTPAPSGPAYGMKLDFSGKYHGGAFGGNARTGGIMTLRDSGTPFPFFIDAKAAATQVRAEGEVGDIFGDARIDVALDIAGPTLSVLYPYINLPLPTTPPYRIKGHLKRTSTQYDLTGMEGRIGSTDIAGDASYHIRPERPLLRAKLKSRVLDMKDLGPLIGVDPDEPAKPAAGMAQPQQAADRRVLPDAEFRLERLNAIDADVTLDAADVRVRGPWAFDDFSAHLILQDGVLKLVPLNFGYAGGELRSDITLDAREKLIRTNAAIAVKRARLSRLFPDVELMKKSEGTLGADIKLKTAGNSVRAMLGRADGTMGAAVTGGDISHLIVEAIGLDAGQALGLLISGEKEQQTRLRCAVATFDVKDGVATSQALVIDTDDTRIDGHGTIDLSKERLNVRLEPQPKDKSILVARSPIDIVGTFADPDFKIDKTTLFARAGAALALGLINPIAALIPLIETGPGTDADCQGLLSSMRGARNNAGGPPPPAKGR